jgi:S1-C subfamily serine protease
VAALLAGLAALLLGVIGVVAHSRRRRGLGLAVLGICLGLGSLVCWTVSLGHFGQDAARAHFDLEGFEPDPEALADLPDAIGRAMRANVLITAEAGWESMFEAGIGSGVILRIEDDMALVVTNRHVIDMEFDERESAAPADLARLAHVTVKMIGQPALGAQIVWVAPDGVDLALLQVPVTADKPQEAHWDAARHVVVGDEVFAVGNPHGLGWTHTGGDVSQIRNQEQASRAYRVIQTSAPINPGNSGGGLYSHDGLLIGINTWTQDKRFSEGLGFSIAIPTLFKLAPAQFRLADRHPADPAP